MGWALTIDAVWPLLLGVLAVAGTRPRPCR
jgi:hypothetical protein